MNIKNIALFCVLFSFLNLNAQKKKDIQAIKNMCGCFEIDFNFAETFQFSKDSNYLKSKNYNAKAIEYAKMIKDDKGHISIQHLLVMDNYVIKHWRQDWIYENRNLLKYDANNSWKHILKSKKAKVNYHDDFVRKLPSIKNFPSLKGMKSIPLTKKNIQSNDIILILTNHSYIDFHKIGTHSKLVIDTRNALENIKCKSKVIKA